MNKTDITVMPEYFDRYINLADNVSIVECLQISLEELREAPLDRWQALKNKTYATGKWTIKDILQHLIDTERVFVYRITAIARGDKQTMIPYDHDQFGMKADANRRELNHLMEELLLLRSSTIKLFESFTKEMLQQQGHGADGVIYGPLALGFMLAGHQRWHFKVLEEKYYHLID